MIFKREVTLGNVLGIFTLAMALLAGYVKFETRLAVAETKLELILKTVEDLQHARR